MCPASPPTCAIFPASVTSPNMFIIIITRTPSISCSTVLCGVIRYPAAEADQLVLALPPLTLSRPRS
ncbi:hypothetical protein FKM82_028499 [Ascaphus truei]